MAEGLTIVPISGLGNRIRVVASVCVAARHISLPIRLVWRPARDFRAGFYDLFAPIPVGEVPIESGGWADEPATKRNFFLPMLLRKRIYEEEWRCFRPNSDFSLIKAAQEHTSLYLDTCYALGPYSSTDVRRLFRPTPELSEKINEVTHLFHGITIGVHIRRTDNLQAIRHSPVSAFRQRIDNMLQSGKADSIFLSTDSEEVRQYFLHTYGNRLITRKPILNRNKLDGIRDAVIDLWALSRTKRILGSYYSSFSETAAEIGDIPLDIITKQA
ncbi:MAG: hypothetical protein ILA34_02500 [Bacteroidaceae bacterium]|nr:hypothetical protein [Bacteroidaceae bacterium]